MLGALLTLTLCLITATSRLFLKKALNQSNPLTGMFTSVIIGFVLLSTLAVPKIIAEYKNINLHGIIIFSLIGLVAPPLVRLLTYIGIDRLGIAQAEPIRSTQPFFAIFFGSLLLGEKPSYTIWLATLLIFIGVYYVTKPKSLVTHKITSSYNFIFPLIAALIAGFITVARKYGIHLLNDPIISAFIAATSALLVFSLFLVLSGKTKQLKFTTKSNSFFLISGILTGLTDILDLWILRLSSVKIVAPLLASTPLFVVILSFIFLKKEEIINRYTWIGTILIVIAIQLVLNESTL